MSVELRILWEDVTSHSSGNLRHTLHIINIPSDEKILESGCHKVRIYSQRIKLILGGSRSTCFSFTIRMDELRMEVGVKESSKKKLARSRLIWAEHVERMGDEKLAKRPDALKLEGNRRQGRPRIRCSGRRMEKQEQKTGVGDCW